MLRALSRPRARLTAVHARSCDGGKSRNEAPTCTVAAVVTTHSSGPCQPTQRCAMANRARSARKRVDKCVRESAGDRLGESDCRGARCSDSLPYMSLLVSSPHPPVVLRWAAAADAAAVKVSLTRILVGWLCTCVELAGSALSALRACIAPASGEPMAPEGRTNFGFERSV